MSNREIERRYTPGVVERAVDGSRTIGGYAAVFNAESRNLGGFVETVDNRAFAKSAGDGYPDVVCRYNHDDNMLLGTSASGTLRLGTDAHGLYYEVDPPECRADVSELVSRGDVRKSSFAFRVMQDDWDMTDAGYPRRSLLSVQLIDVAPVNTPAYPDTSAGLRSLASKFEADYEEVRTLAADNELRKFFVRTDRPVEGRTTGAMAMVELLRLKDTGL